MTNERLERAHDDVEIEEELAEEPDMSAYDPAMKNGERENVGDLPEGMAPPQSHRVSGPGQYTLYRTEGGRTITVDENNVRSKLRQRHPGGQRVFVRNPRGVRWWHQPGQFKCFLHQDDPDRARWDSMGLPVCPREEGLASEFSRERHMVGTHRDAWAAIQRQKAQEHQNEERAFQKSMMEFQRSMMESYSANISNQRDVDLRNQGNKGQR